jgi:hypothetical protein
MEESVSGGRAHPPLGLASLRAPTPTTTFVEASIPVLDSSSSAAMEEDTVVDVAVPPTPLLVSDNTLQQSSSSGGAGGGEGHNSPAISAGGDGTRIRPTSSRPSRASTTTAAAATTTTTAAPARTPGGRRVGSGGGRKPTMAPSFSTSATSPTGVVEDEGKNNGVEGGEAGGSVEKPPQQKTATIDHHPSLAANPRKTENAFVPKPLSAPFPPQFIATNKAPDGRSEYYKEQAQSDLKRIAAEKAQQQANVESGTTPAATTEAKRTGGGGRGGGSRGAQKVAKPEEFFRVPLSAALSAVVMGLKKVKEETDVMNKLNSAKFREEIGLKPFPANFFKSSTSSTSSSSTTSSSSSASASTPTFHNPSISVIGRAVTNSMKLSHVSEYLRAAMEGYGTPEPSPTPSTLSTPSGAAGAAAGAAVAIAHVTASAKAKAIAALPILTGLVNIPKECTVLLREGNGASSTHLSVSSIFDAWTAMMRGSHGPPINFINPSQMPDILTNLQASTEAKELSSGTGTTAGTDVDRARKRELEAMEQVYLKKEKLAMGFTLPSDEMLRPHAVGSGLGSYPTVTKPPRPSPVRDTYGFFDEQFKDLLIVWDFVKTFSIPPAHKAASAPILDVSMTSTGEDILTLIPYCKGVTITNLKEIGSSLGLNTENDLLSVSSSSSTLAPSPSLPLPLQLAASSYTDALKLEGGDYTAEGGSAITSLEDRPPNCLTSVVDPALSSLADFVASLRGTSFKSMRFLARVHVALIRFLLEDFDRLNNIDNLNASTAAAATPVDEDVNGGGGGGGGGGKKSIHKKKSKNNGASKSNTRSGLSYYTNDDSNSDLDDENIDISLKKGSGGGPGGERIPRALLRKVTFSDLYCDACGERERFLESELRYLTTLTWPTVLRRLLLTNSIGALLRQHIPPRAVCIAAMLGDVEYVQLPPALRLELLKGLIDAVIATDSFNSVMHRLGNELADEIAKVEAEKEAEENFVKDRVRTLKESIKEKEKDFDPFIKVFYQRDIKAKEESKGGAKPAAAAAAAAAPGKTATASSPKGGKTSSSSASTAAADADVTDDEDTSSNTTAMMTSSKRELEKRAMILSLLIDSARSHDLPQMEKAISLGKEAGFEKDLGRKLGKSYEPEYAIALRARDRLLAEREETDLKSNLSKFIASANDRIMIISEERRVRVLHLGSDAQNRSYWYFSGDRSRIYVEEPVPPTNSSQEAARVEARTRAHELSLDWKDLVETGGLTANPSVQYIAAQKRKNLSSSATAAAAVAAASTTAATTSLPQDAIVIDGEVVAAASSSTEQNEGEDNSGAAVVSARPASRQSLLNLSRPPSSSLVEAGNDADTPLAAASSTTSKEKTDASKKIDSSSSSSAAFAVVDATATATGSASSAATAPPSSSSSAAAVVAVGPGKRGPGKKINERLTMSAYIEPMIESYPQALTAANVAITVHAPELQSTRFYYYDNQEDVTALIASLDVRGVREAALDETLKKYSLLWKTYMPATRAEAISSRLANPFSFSANNNSSLTSSSSSSLLIDDDKILSAAKKKRRVATTASEMTIPVIEVVAADSAGTDSAAVGVPEVQAMETTMDDVKAENDVITNNTTNTDTTTASTNTASSNAVDASIATVAAISASSDTIMNVDPEAGAAVTINDDTSTRAGLEKLSEASSSTSTEATTVATTEAASTAVAIKPAAASKKFSTKAKGSSASSGAGKAGGGMVSGLASITLKNKGGLTNPTNLFHFNKERLAQRSEKEAPINAAYAFLDTAHTLAVEVAALRKLLLTIYASIEKKITSRGAVWPSSSSSSSTTTSNVESVQANNQAASSKWLASVPQAISQTNFIHLLLELESVIYSVQKKTKFIYQQRALVSAQIHRDKKGKSTFLSASNLSKQEKALNKKISAAKKAITQSILNSGSSSSSSNNDVSVTLAEVAAEVATTTAGGGVEIVNPSTSTVAPTSTTGAASSTAVAAVATPTPTTDAFYPDGWSEAEDEGVLIASSRKETFDTLVNDADNGDDDNDDDDDDDDVDEVGGIEEKDDKAKKVSALIDAPSVASRLRYGALPFLLKKNRKLRREAFSLVRGVNLSLAPESGSQKKSSRRKSASVYSSSSAAAAVAIVPGSRPRPLSRSTDPITGLPILPLNSLDYSLRFPVFHPEAGEGHEEEEGEDDEEEEGEENDDFPRENRPIWRYRSDRRWWRSDLMASRTYSHISLSAQILFQKASSGKLCPEPTTLLSLIDTDGTQTLTDQQQGMIDDNDDDAIVPSSRGSKQPLKTDAQGGGKKKGTSGTGPKLIFSSSHSAAAAANSSSASNAGRSASGFPSAAASNPSSSSASAAGGADVSTIDEDGAGGGGVGGKKRARPPTHPKIAKDDNHEIDSDYADNDNVDTEDEGSNVVMKMNKRAATSKIYKDEDMEANEGNDDDTEDEETAAKSAKKLKKVTK